MTSLKALNLEQQLRAFGFNSANMMLDDQSALKILTIVRVVPDKRIVCRAIWQDQNVFVKIFAGPHAKRYAARDAAGVKKLAQAGILTPPLLKVEGLSGYAAIALIFQEIENTQNAEQQYMLANDAEKRQIGLSLVGTLAQLHQHHLLQTDLYLKNFLIDKNLVYTLDGDGIRELSICFAKQQKLKNLAILLSKFDVLEALAISEYYRHYCSCVGMAYHKRDEKKLYKLTQKNRFFACRAYADKKVFRNCSDVTVIHNFHHFFAFANGFEVTAEMLSNLDISLADRQRNLKNGNTCTVGLDEIASVSVVIKRYNIKNFWHRISRALRPSRAALSWANGHRLQLLNIATAKPLALIEERFGWLRGKAYFLSEYLDAPDVMQFFSQSKNISEQDTVVKNLAQLMHRLYLLKITHGDLKGTNIKIIDQQPMLIDLDAMQAHVEGCSMRFERRHTKDLLRLIRNWDANSQVYEMLKTALMSEYDEAKQVLIRAGIA